MVFIWWQLTKVNPNYTPVQVSLNDVIMVFAFAPILALLLGVTEIAALFRTKTPPSRRRRLPPNKNIGPLPLGRIHLKCSVYSVLHL